ncbi:hypothetical protein I3760_07G043800 [Carya illinoinensis]|nr:hypothetical protein I3760_07G043800 [Carya illinoinensis]KAG2696116.1 hypothetical protein I3760_07G043800 [Carya illinoinensis]KAG2696117.1 hypothetical protein I3760_07G043800 [Carya illinoinensis]KAG2696118.1 hypothetical protein I3760_07G043800 [Carya illinoinensis]
MATSKSRTSSFSRNLTAVPLSNMPGLKYGPNGTVFISSGIPDLDKILGGGFALGSLVMVMEDAEAPHHMLLLRNFMSQGLVHKQPLLYASPSKDPKGFLGTLPSPRSCKVDKDKSRDDDPEQEGLRIAWQYKKYFGEHQQTVDNTREMMAASPLLVVLPFSRFVLHNANIPMWNGYAFFYQISEKHDPVF